MKKLLKICGLVLLGLLLAAQLIPVDRSNPPIEQAMTAPPEVEAILRTSCYDCHSNETHWELPAYVAPFSWLIARDVHEGRDELNFSAWNRLSPRKAAKMPEEIVEEVVEGEMPPRLYFITHPSARLSPAQIDTLRTWANSLGQGAGQDAGETKKSTENRAHHDEHEHDDD